MARCISLLIIAAALLINSISCQPLEVVTLTPKNFEHETQAATGQTTGQWCVLFTNSSASNSLQVAAEDAWEHLAEDEDKSTIMAKVDLASDGGTALSKRFNLTATPAALLLRDRSMYPLDLASGPADADKMAAAVHAFMDGGYEHQVPHTVPREASLLDMALEVAKSLSVSPTPMLWAGIACLAVGFVLFLAFVIAGIWYMYAPDKPRQPAAAKAAAGAAKKDEGAAAGGDDDGGDAATGGDRQAGSTRATRRRAA